MQDPNAGRGGWCGGGGIGRSGCGSGSVTSMVVVCGGGYSGYG